MVEAVVIVSVEVQLPQGQRWVGEFGEDLPMIGMVVHLLIHS